LYFVSNDVRLTSLRSIPVRPPIVHLKGDLPQHP